MWRRILVCSLAVFLFAQVELKAVEAPKLASRIPADAVGTVFIMDLPALAQGKAWMSSLSQAFDGEVVIALLDISQEKKLPPFVVMGKVDPASLRWFLDARVKPILRRNLGRVEFEPSEGMMAIVVNDSPMAFYAVKDEVLSFSLDRKVVANFISKPVPTEKSLAAHPLFAKVLERTAPKSRSIFFVNVRRILDTFGGEISERERAVLKGLGILDIEAVGGCDEVADGAQAGSLSLITSGKPRGVLALCAQPPAPPTTPRYVPGDYSFYARFRFASFADAWKQTVKMLEEMSAQETQDELADFLEGFREATELDFEKDMLDALGGEVSVAVAVPEKLRIPDGVVFLEVKNKETVESVIAKIIPGPLGETEEYKNVAIRTVDLRPLMLSYAFLDKYLVVGTAPSVVKSVVDTAGTEASLADNPAFRTAFDRLGGGSHLCYLDVGSALPLLLTTISNAAARDPYRAGPAPPKWVVIGKLCRRGFDRMNRIHKIESILLSCRKNNASTKRGQQ